MCTIKNVLVRHKFKSVLLILLWITGIIYSVRFITKGSDKKEKGVKLLQSRYSPTVFKDLFRIAEIKEYCNPPDQISLGSEGQVRDGYSLELVAVLVRHGDRGPLLKIKNQSLINCGVKEPLKYPLFGQFTDVMNSKLKWYRASAEFHSFPPYPYSKQCWSGHLTQLGALQELRLGRLLGNLYNKHWNLLSQTWNVQNVLVFSTMYARTFQSALAFMFGFLPSLSPDKKLTIHAVEDTSFCGKHNLCRCPGLKYMQGQLNKKMRNLLISHQAVVELIHKISSFVKPSQKTPNITQGGTLFDSLMGYLCHGAKLPCETNDNFPCITRNKLKKLVSYLDWEGKQLATYPIYQKKSRLRMYGFMVMLQRLFHDKINKKLPERFILFSGHDITLAALSTTLGYANGIFPPYVSRIIFELYKSNNTSLTSVSNYFIRILFNGKDITKYAPFCKNVTKITKGQLNGNLFSLLCPVENFFDFVSNSYFHNFGVSSFSEACRPSPP
ncbi:2-phosphoxylose phosphatase 1-like [Limulus polyphemus]|uniref:2-phosphoxylose phosphatase 1 n=1 Tax=Limulus polyphemus TaxID=6850 RepID=A0ABM1BZ65_LIMPO|nr:2-phosphoxylose phosphatase 1-like [Limulus polyphemus]